MDYKKKRKEKQKLTKRIGSGENVGGHGEFFHGSPADPRIVELVRMLARKAAERDYVRKIRRNGSINQKLQEED